MKKMTVCALASLGVLLLAAQSSANPPMTPVVRPVPLTLLTAKIVSVTAGPPDGNGGFQVDVGVQNVSSAVRHISLTMAGAPQGAESADVPAGQTHHFVFGDPAGGPGSCGLVNQKEYDFTLNDGSGAAASSHKAILKAMACTLKNTVYNPWDQLTPDHTQNLETNALFVNSATIQTAETCTSSLKVQATVANTTNGAQSNVRVLLKEGNTVKATAVATVGAHGRVNVELQPSQPIMAAGVISIEPGTGYALATVPTVQQSLIQVRMNPTCNYSADIDPGPAGPAPVLK